MVLLNDLIGIPYKEHGRDKNGYDCYGLAIEVERRYGIALPDYLYDNLTKEKKKELYNIAENGIKHIILDKPVEGCIVVLNVLNMPVHIAVYIGNDRIIHSTFNCGVVIERLKKWENRIKGYYKIENQII